MTHSQHPQNKPFKVEDIYEAARYILQGVSPVGIYVPKAPMAQPLPSNTLSADGVIETENLGAFLAEFSKTIVDAIKEKERSSAPHKQSDSGNRLRCNMCGGPHFIKDCKVINEYISAGKCKRNAEGKVVLDTNSFVPQSIGGEFLL